MSQSLRPVKEIWSPHSAFERWGRKLGGSAAMTKSYNLEGGLESMAKAV